MSAKRKLSGASDQTALQLVGRFAIGWVEAYRTRSLSLQALQSTWGPGWAKAG
jgi:hypothetical protein